MTELQNVWDHLARDKTLAEVGEVNRGVLDDADRPHGVCWPCKKLADEAMFHESPGTAECCKGCDAYQGEDDK